MPAELLKKAGGKIMQREQYALFSVCINISGQLTFLHCHEDPAGQTLLYVLVRIVVPPLRRLHFQWKPALAAFQQSVIIFQVNHML